MYITVQFLFRVRSFQGSHFSSVRDVYQAYWMAADRYYYVPIGTTNFNLVLLIPRFVMISGS
jgi:hypothetical protein